MTLGQFLHIRSVENPSFFNVRSYPRDVRICQCCTNKKDDMKIISNGCVQMRICKSCRDSLKEFFEKKGFKV